MVDLIKKNNVKNYINGKGYKLQNNFYDDLNQEIEHLLKKCIERAESNFRNTIMTKDL